MAQAGDFFRTTFLIEVAGVVTQQSMDWQLDSIDGADPIVDVLNDIALAYWATIENILTDQCLLSCIHYDNWSRPEMFVGYPLLPGQNIDDSHPQFQVIRLNRYGQTIGVLSDPVYRGATNLSGIAEEYSTRGRINDLSVFDAWVAFNSDQLQTDPAGWTITPHVNYVLDPGPPIVRDFKPIISCVLNPTFLTLRGRKTSACGGAAGL